MARNATAIINRDHALGSAYPVSIGAFDGPLDLLLQLIERNELDISEVSLRAVTDQYLDTLEQLANVEPEALADFLAVATRLLLLKSANLLPRADVGEDEEEDAGDALVRQLIEYRRFRQAADALRSRSESGQRVHVRQTQPGLGDRKRIGPPDLSDVAPEDLQAVLARVLRQMPVEPPAPRVAVYQVTLAEQIARVREYVVQAHRALCGKGRRRVLFSAVLGSTYTRTEAVVTFLAILELIKQEELRVEQDATFGEIYLLPIGVDGSSSRVDDQTDLDVVEVVSDEVETTHD